MCGFVGVISRTGNLPDSEQLCAMRDLLVHRGPDDAGEFIDTHVALGFRRLSIVDLSPRGHQPMHNSAGTLTIVFNGEIYNHVELRATLKADGYQFHSDTDTEVLLALYERHGTDMFRYINGMFAFALYDRSKHHVILARDRMGVKPLFYYTFRDGLAFGSELKSLQPLPHFPTAISTDALGMYMRFNYIPGGACIYSNVYKVPKGQYIMVNIDRPDAPVTSKYWEIDWNAEPEEHSEDTWINRIEELLYDAVRIRLRADVPIGTFLSGGIDSGLVTAMASQVVGKDLKTFTVGFPGVYDEQANAELTARHLGVNSCVERAEGDELDLLPELAAHFDEPFADMSMVPTYQICKKMKEHATVILSGDGGDELFAGYPTHLVAWKLRFLDSIPDSLVGPSLKTAARFFPEASWPRRNLLRNSLPSRFRSAFYQRDICEEWQNDVLRPEYVLQPGKLLKILDALHSVGMGRTSLDRAQSGDIELLLPDNMLLKVDRMSMKASVEVRSPFLDYRFAELLPRIPPRLRVKNGQSKYLLRKLAERYLPMQIVYGPKHGFDAPLDKWLFNDSKDRIRERLLKENEALKVTQRGGVERLLESINTKHVYRPAVFRVLAWKLWAEKNLN